MEKLTFTVLLVVFFSGNEVYSQTIIYLDNPSFEDSPRRGGEFSTPINSWTDCGLFYFPTESPPDIHPVPATTPTILPGWGVASAPHNGETYLGLVTRYNDSWESVSQSLETTLIADSCYRLSVWLCQSSAYKSGTRRSQATLEPFIDPIALYVWGGNSPCVMARVLAMTGPIDHSEWKEYVFEFTPAQNFTSIVLQAYFYVPNNSDQSIDPAPYNGHVLVDHLSPISKIECK